MLPNNYIQTASQLNVMGDRREEMSFGLSKVMRPGQTMIAVEEHELARLREIAMNRAQAAAKLAEGGAEGNIWPHTESLDCEIIYRDGVRHRLQEARRG